MFPNNDAKVLATLKRCESFCDAKRRKEQFLPIIDLPYAKELAAPRVEEMERFIIRFEEECYVVFRNSENIQRNSGTGILSRCFF